MIIIPTYNERKNISELVERIRKFFSTLPIMFIDDNSPDGTEEEIRILQQKDSNIHLISRSQKSGFASAYIEGFRIALENFNPEFIVTMDADLSHPPEKLPELVGLAKLGKVAIGSRYVEGGNVKNWKLKRKLLSWFGNFYAHFLIQLPLRDITGGYMAIPAKKILQLELQKMQNRGYAFLMELKLKLAAIGSDFVEVPITFVERKEGESKIASSIVIEGIKYPAKVFIHRQVYKNYPAWLVFIISFGVYLYTLPHSIFIGDSPEFITSAITLGVPHPPGYPAYVLLAKMFTFLPFDTIEFRIGLFSALSASLALIIFYFLFLRIVKDPIVAFVTSLILGFSDIFWSQAIMAKVYAPSLLLILVILLLFIKFLDEHKPKYLITTMFLFGLGFGLHQVTLLLLPLLGIVILFYIHSQPEGFKSRYSIRPMFYAILWCALGLSVYLFLPIRANMEVEYYSFPKIFNASRIQNFEGFKGYILRADYGDIGGKFVLLDKLRFFGAALEYVWQQFYWLLLFVPIGWWFLFTKKKFLILTFAAFLLNTFGIILIRNGTYGFENDVFYSYYYLPAYAMVAIWIGMGIVWLYRKIISAIPKPSRVGLSFMLLILPLWFIIKNYEKNQLKNFDSVNIYTREMLNSLPQHALLLTNFIGSNSDTILFGLHYQQIVKKVRQDVKIMTIYDIHPEVDPRSVAMVYNLYDHESARYHLVNYVLNTEELKNRPIYTTYLLDTPRNPSWTSIPNGLVYKFSYNKNDELENHQINFTQDLHILESNMFGQDMLAQYYYTQAAFYAKSQNFDQAQANFIQAIKYDYKPFGLDQKAYINYRNKVLLKKS